MVGYTSKLVRWGGYSFDEPSIYEIAKRAEALAGSAPNLTARLAGGDELKATNVEELLADTLLRSKQIVQLEISANDYPRDCYVWIYLRDRVAFDAVNVNVTVDRQSGSTARADIESIIEGQRQWYAVLYPGLWWLPLWAFIWFLLAAYLISLGLRAMSAPGIFLPALVTTVGATLAAVIAIFLMSRMFPKVVFEIGFSKRRSESAKLWRVTVGSVLGLGILAAVIGGFIVEHIEWS
jgi:hypothetical protein